jgi:hypothetical protein
MHNQQQLFIGLHKARVTLQSSRSPYASADADLSIIETESSDWTTIF